MPSERCWFDSTRKSFASDVVTTRPGVRGDYRDPSLPRHATCAIACPVPPVEISEPVLIKSHEAERTVTEYERLPCDFNYGDVVCRYRRHTMYQYNTGCTLIGRRPRGLGDLAQVSGAAAGAWLAKMAALEAASVPAFEELTESLVSFDAPAALIRDSRRAADDERRHARLVTELARRHGVEPVAAEVARTGPISRQRLGRDNLLEGCLRETLGAALGYWQAEHARDPVVRKVMRSIATDEARHADLSWRIHAWLGHPRHDDELAAEIARQRETIVADEVIEELGHPDPDQTRALVSAIDASLWSTLMRAA